MPRQLVPKSDVVLVPVLEVEPYLYSERPLPDSSPASADPEAWSAYFHACLRDAGFGDVRQTVPGSNFITARQLVGTTFLEHLVRATVEAGRPAGGLSLFVDGAQVLTPSCCGDLLDLENWARAVAEKPASSTVWIGHPDLKIAFDGGRVTLTEQVEYPSSRELLELTMPTEWLERAVAAARAEALAFRRELEPIVKRVLTDPIETERVLDDFVLRSP